MGLKKYEERIYIFRNRSLFDKASAIGIWIGEVSIEIQIQTQIFTNSEMN